MRTLALAAVAALGLAGTAQAGTIDVVSYGTPDSDAFNSVTTDGYSYYTGPIQFNLKSGASFLVYCADLNHYLSTPSLYQSSPLVITGQGAAVTAAQSAEMGWLVKAGFYAFNHGDMDKAAAAQAAIWDVEYGTTSVSTNATISSDLATLLTEASSFASGPSADALIPFGQKWYQNSGASQQMLFTVPEPSTIALFGVGLLGLGLVRRAVRR